MFTTKHKSGLWVCGDGTVFKKCPFNDGAKPIMGYISNGYRLIKHKGKVYRVHRLVSECFLQNPDNLPQVNHKDGNKLNNHVSNLEWVSQSDNIKHDLRRRENKPIKVKRNDGKIYMSMRQAAESCGVDSKCVWAVINGFQKTTGGYSFSRAGVS